jgi:hypothetical protein
LSSRRDDELRDEVVAEPELVAQVDLAAGEVTLEVVDHQPRAGADGLGADERAGERELARRGREPVADLLRAVELVTVGEYSTRAFAAKAASATSVSRWSWAS